MIGSMCRAAPATPAARRTARRRAARPSAPARRRPARSRPARRRTRTSRRTRACAPRRRTSPCTAAPALMEAVHRSPRASAGRARRAHAHSTSAPTAWCSRTTRATSPPSWTSTSPAPSPSTNLRRACRWCRATCPRHSSTRRRRRAWRRRAAPAPASSCTSMTPGTSTTAGTAARRTVTRRSTTRRTTTWRRGTAWAGCCWAARRCTSTSPWTGPRSTRRTSTPPPARPTTRPCQVTIVWKRRCRTPPRICTGSERDAAGRYPGALDTNPGLGELANTLCPHSLKSEVEVDQAVIEPRQARVKPRQTMAMLFVSEMCSVKSQSQPTAMARSRAPAA